MRLQACEMFILELTLRSWMHAEENKRRTMQRNDVAAAIVRRGEPALLPRHTAALTYTR
jgi:histone H3/H4